MSLSKGRLALLTIAGLLVAAVAIYVTLARSGQFQLTRDELIQKYADADSKFIRIKDIDVHYKDQGEGPVIVLFHGSFSSLRTWDGVVDRLKDRYRLIRFDLPSAALSGEIPVSNVGLQLEDFVAAFLDQLGVDKVSVAGTSSGGIIAYRFASKYPNRTTAVVIANSPSAVVDNSATGTSPLMNAFTYVNTNILKHQPKLYWRLFLESLYGDSTRVTEDIVQQYYDVGRKIRGPLRVPTMFSRVNDNTEIDGVLAKVRAPTLLLWGLPDRVLPEATARALQSKLTSAKSELVILQGTGHYPPLESPVLIADTMEPFIAKAIANEAAAAGRPILTVNPVVLRDKDQNKSIAVRVTAPMEGENLPIVLFSHGAQYSKDDYLPLTEYWAAHGYVVFQPTHIESRSLGLSKDDPRVPLAWKSRILDMRHVLDALDEIEEAVPMLKGRIDRTHVIAAGHSFGGHTASALIGARVRPVENGDEVDLTDDRVAAAILMAPPGFGAGLRNVSWDHMTKPTLVIVGQEDANIELKQPWEVHADPYIHAPAGEKCLGVMAGMKHYLGGILGTNRTEEAAPSPESLAEIQRQTLAFLNTWAKGAPEWASMRDAMLREKPATLSQFECK